MRSVLSWCACLVVFFLGCPACKKKEPLKRKREDIVGDASRERRRLNNFAMALRKVIDWRQTQPAASTEIVRRAMIKEVVKRFAEINTRELPAQAEAIWSRVLAAWHELDASGTADPELLKKGAAAAEELNAYLADNGFPDVRL